MSEMKHSPIGASSAKRWMHCPGSVALSQKVGKLPSSVHAEEGTAAHELGELSLRLNMPPSAFIGQTLNGFEVTEEMASAVAQYVDVVYGYVEHVNEVNGLKGPPGKLNIETEFVIAWVHPEAFGTNDSCIAGIKTLVVLDYKHGEGVQVQAEGNEQLMYYGLGALGLYTEAGLLLPEEVELVIVQPRYRGSNPVKKWTISTAELIEWGKTPSNLPRKKLCQVLTNCLTVKDVDGAREKLYAHSYGVKLPLPPS